MKYVAYYRVSTKKQGDSGLGLESQKNYVHHYYPNIEKEFTEVESAKNITDRPVLQEAIRYCKETGSTLVVAKVDRLSRDTVDGLTVLKQLNGNIRFCDIPGVPDDFVITMILALAQRERELISIRTKSALRVKKQRGIKLGHTPNLHGQKQGAEANRLKALNDESNKRAASMIKILVDQGYNLDKIASRLNEENFLTSRGNHWSKVTVGRIINRTL